MILFQICIALVTVVAWGVGRYLIGNRIYVSEESYVTLREVLLPLLVFLFETSSQLIFGYSLLPWIVIFCCCVGLFLLQRRIRLGRWALPPFFHQLSSVTFLVLVVATVVIQLWRVI